jgi:hypothetical protein
MKTVNHQKLQMNPPPLSQLRPIGLAKGQFTVPDDFNAPLPEDVLQAARKRTALLALAQDAQGRREERMRFGEAQLRRVGAERGLDWDHLSEDEGETFVDDLLPEK